MAFSDVVELGATEFSTKYKVIAKLGEGGMALVHLAVARGVGNVRKLVVLKSIRPELIATQKTHDMFLAEARVAATLNHPNIVQSFEVVVSKKRPVLVMEYLDGQPLERVMRLENLPLAVALFALKETLRGLDYAHNVADLDGAGLNLVHRDVSPQNIFVTYEGQVKLLDFGIAKVVGATCNTETGEIKGKVRYMAPEQMFGNSAVDRRADVFSVGVILWEALTGRRLWDDRSDVQVIQAVTARPIAAPSTVKPDVAARLDAICLRALAPSAEQRYESAAAMLADLEGAIEELGLRTDAGRVSTYVSGAFASLRASVRATVEAQMRNDTAVPVRLIASEGGTLLVEDDASAGDLWAQPSTLTVRRVEARRRRQRKVFTYVGIAAIGAVGVAPFISRHTQPANATSVSGQRISDQQPRKVDEGVHVSIDARPREARIFWDGEPLAGNPYTGELPRDALAHVVRVEASGFRTQSLTVGLKDLIDRRVELVPEATASPARPTPPTSRSVSNHPAAAPSAPASAAHPLAACTPPFTFDPNGIKHFKPECLK
jgi:serine/threonine-protein kinase